MSYYFIAIGGTGNKILESLVYACAADALYTVGANGKREPIPALNASSPYSSCASSSSSSVSSWNFSSGVRPGSRTI